MCVCAPALIQQLTMHVFLATESAPKTPPKPSPKPPNHTKPHQKQHLGCCAVSGASLTYYSTRIVSVLVGILLGALVSSFVLPWYTSCWALETMGAAFRTAVELPLIGYNKLYQDASRAPAAVAAAAQVATAAAVTAKADSTAAADLEAAASAAAGEAALRAARPFADYGELLRTGVVEPLTAVQASLIRDTASWQRGVLATPCVVRVARWLRGMGGGRCLSGVHLFKFDVCVRSQSEGASPPDAAVAPAAPAARFKQPRTKPPTEPTGPKQVPQMLHAMLFLVSPLHAMQAALRPPDVTGGFLGVTFEHLVFMSHAANRWVSGCRLVGWLVARLP